MKLKYIIALTAGIALATTMAEAKGAGNGSRTCDPAKVCTEGCTQDQKQECTQERKQDCDKECTQSGEKKQDGSGSKGQKKGGKGACKK